MQKLVTVSASNSLNLIVELSMEYEIVALTQFDSNKVADYLMEAWGFTAVVIGSALIEAVKQVEAVMCLQSKLLKNNTFAK